MAIRLRHKTNLTSSLVGQLNVNRWPLKIYSHALKMFLVGHLLLLLLRWRLRFSTAATVPGGGGDGFHPFPSGHFINLNLI